MKFIYSLVFWYSHVKNELNYLTKLNSSQTAPPLLRALGCASTEKGVMANPNRETQLRSRKLAESFRFKFQPNTISESCHANMMRKLCTFWSRKSECAAVLTGLHNGMQVSFLIRAGCGFLQHSESSVVRLFRFSLAFTSPFHPLIVHPSSLLPTGRRLPSFPRLLFLSSMRQHRIYPTHGRSDPCLPLVPFDSLFTKLEPII